MLEIQQKEKKQLLSSLNTLSLSAVFFQNVEAKMMYALNVTAEFIEALKLF